MSPEPCTCGNMDHGTSSMHYENEARAISHGPWSTGHEPWAINCETGTMGQEPWAMNHEPWGMYEATSMKHKPWGMSHEAWAVIYEPWATSPRPWAMAMSAMCREPWNMHRESFMLSHKSRPMNHELCSMDHERLPLSCLHASSPLPNCMAVMPTTLTAKASNNTSTLWACGSQVPDIKKWSACQSDHDWAMAPGLLSCRFSWDFVSQPGLFKFVYCNSQNMFW